VLRSKSTGLLRGLIKALLRVAFRAYYSNIDVQGMERLPAEGPVLLVCNHPNSLVDPAILVHLLPRRIAFGAKHTLFKNALFRPILDAFGAIPLVRRSDDTTGGARNLEAFERYVNLLGAGRVSAIFPEGLSQDEPRLAPVKTGAGRIALQAESGRDFRLGLTLLPVGLQFHPRRAFRADALVRFGKPVPLADLEPLHGTSPREAVRELTDRIEEALKSVSLHLEDAEKVTLSERVMEVYWHRIRSTGLGTSPSRALRGDLLHRIVAGLKHFEQHAAGEVAEIERRLGRYERLRAAAGIDRRLLEDPSMLLPGPLGHVQAVVEAVLGAVPALLGALTSGIPYLVTRAYAGRSARRDGAATLSLAHIVVGALVFPLCYGAFIAIAAWKFSPMTALVVALLLPPLGLFTRFYFRRIRSNVAHVGERTTSWFKLDEVLRVREARDELIAKLDSLRNRYRAEVLGWDPLPTPRQRNVSNPPE